MATRQTGAVSRRMLSVTAFLLVGVIAVITATARWWRQDLAHSVTAVPVGPVQIYTWMPNGTLFAVSEPDPRVPAAAAEAFLMNLETGERKRLPAVESRFRRWETAAVEDLAGSPDGRRIAFRGTVSNSFTWMNGNLNMGGRHYLSANPPMSRAQVARTIAGMGGSTDPVAQWFSYRAVMDLDGPAVSASEDRNYTQGLWLPDGRHLLLQSFESVLEQATFRIQPTDLPAAVALPFNAPADIRALIGTTRDGMLVGTDFSSRAPVYPPTTTLHLFLVPARAPYTVARRYTLYPPMGMELLDLAVSPRGDRLAWHVAWTTQPPRFWKRVARWLQHLPGWRDDGEPKRMEALFVSRLDGSEMRSLGAVEAPGTLADPDREHGAGWGHLDAVRWTPDGTRLSYLFRGTLWTVPAEN